MDNAGLIKNMVVDMYIYLLRKKGVVVHEEGIKGGAKKKSFAELAIDALFQAVIFTIVIVILVMNGVMAGGIDTASRRVRDDPEAVINDIIINHTPEVQQAIEMVNSAQAEVPSLLDAFS